MVFCPTDGTSLRADASSGDLIGTVIADRYLVNELLGEGGMGKVYLASHVRLPQKAAIKVLHQDMVQDAGAVARFNREAANAARIEHDRVARVFDFGETSDGLVYLAMEFVPGKTLRDLLNDSTRLTAVRAANLVYQVAEGLDAAHRLNIVHRDLKPDNILVVTDDNGGDRCKVVDFGIAKVTNSSETQLTQAGMLVGTPEFMSPEQVLGEQLDGRSDVYALALVAYEMFTGELPFEGNTPERKLTARLIQDPCPLAAVAPDVDWPAPLQEAFDHALVREPEGRTATALEFADAIVTAVEGWTGLAVLRQRTPMSTTAITASADESTSAIKRSGTSTTGPSAATVGARTPTTSSAGAAKTSSAVAAPSSASSTAS
jgi:eukaryotic-like serine/threonine-protein kinase